MTQDSESSEGELFLQYERQVNLAEDLVLLARRKLAADPAWRLETLFEKVRGEVAAGNWKLTDGELDWVLRRVEQTLREPTT